MLYLESKEGSGNEFRRSTGKFSWSTTLSVTGTRRSTGRSSGVFSISISAGISVAESSPLTIGLL